MIYTAHSPFMIDADDLEGIRPGLRGAHHRRDQDQRRRVAQVIPRNCAAGPLAGLVPVYPRHFCS